MEYQAADGSVIAKFETWLGIKTVGVFEKQQHLEM